MLIDDDSVFQRILRETTEFSQLDVQVGFPEPKLDPDGLFVAQIAAWNEFGTDEIPERPFLSLAIDSNHPKIREQYKIELNRIIDGKQNALTAARRLGIFGVNLVKKQIRTSPKWAERNSDTTVERKGSSKPLVDTGEMLNSVGWVVLKNGSPIASSI